MSTQPPVLAPTPGAGGSQPEIVDLLIHNQQLFLDAWKFYQRVTAFFAALHSWQADAIQSLANNQPVRPAPVPPAGLELPAHLTDVPPLPTSNAQTIEPGGLTVVQPKSQFGTYPAPGDQNPAGTVIGNPYRPGEKLIKVIGSNPFGHPMWWEEI